MLDADTTATVGRYRADVGDRSTVGAMVTDRRGGGYFNNVVAVDSPLPDDVGRQRVRDGGGGHHAG